MGTSRYRFTAKRGSRASSHGGYCRGDGASPAISRRRSKLFRSTPSSRAEGGGNCASAGIGKRDVSLGLTEGEGGL
jgi:hypothetical protein